MFSIGVDIGGSHISSCAYSHGDKTLCRETFSYKKINPYGTKEEILTAWVEALEATIKILGKSINGIGVAMPGPFDYYNGISKITDVEKLQSLYDVNLRLELAERLKFRPSQIRFINDATAFSVAEALIGKASKYKKAIAITLGTGLGSSFLLQGKPIIKDKQVPEGGFLYNQYYQNVFADDIFSTRGIINAFEKKSGKRLKNVKELCELVDVDSNARKVFHDFGVRLADFINPYIEEFEAEVLVFGGNISKAFEFFGPALKEALRGVDEIYVSEFGEEAAIIGSALLLDEDYYAEIEETLKLM
ncbi:ROK family protein [Muricauda oceani]|uniref:ROK family protein n=1 Tax=Flagellimonas oceani TaxID=2698672 RepID=A0A6G7J514_9FLAO|nr:ROK family protein [Allomuricauda oceani]MBW8242685.1 ROK family protein [Allomuricauda oceani]QII45572.1 ROK family protein [Allomuricauda oceani]